MNNTTPSKPGEAHDEGPLEGLGEAISEVVTGAVPDESLAEAGHRDAPDEPAADPAPKPAAPTGR